jgi:hypothetical protein
MTKKYEDEVNPAQVAELELEIEELKQRLVQREHDTAEIVDRLGLPMQPRTYLVGLWVVIGVRLALWMLLFPNNSGFLGLIAEVLFVGLSFMLAVKWVSGEARRNLGVCITKCCVLFSGLFVAALDFSGGRVLDGDMNGGGSPIGTLVWVSFLMVVMFSPFCPWLARSIAQFVQHPIETTRMMFRREGVREDEGELIDDGLGEN